MADPVDYFVRWSEVNVGMMEMAVNVRMVIEFGSLAEMVKDGVYGGGRVDGGK